MSTHSESGALGMVFFIKRTKIGRKLLFLSGMKVWNLLSYLNVSMSVLLCLFLKKVVLTENLNRSC